MKKNVLSVGFFFVLSLIIAGVWLSQGHVLLGHDTSVYLYSWRYFVTFLYSWVSFNSFGGSLIFTRGFIMNRLPEIIGLITTGSIQSAEYFMIVFWQIAIFISMFIFIQYILSHKNTLGIGILASLFYGLNYYILLGWFIAERAKFSLYIALPFIFILLLALLFSKIHAVVIGLGIGLVLFFLNGAGSPPLFGPILVLGFLFCIFGVMYSVRTHDRNRLRRLFIGIAVACLSAVALNFYLIGPLLDLAIHSYGSKVSSMGGIDGVLAWERMVSSHASVLNIFRLLPLTDFNSWEPDFRSYTFVQTMLYAMMGFIPFLIVLAGFFRFGFRTNDMRLRFSLLLLAGMFCIGVFLSGGSHPPFGFLYVYLMKFIPGFTVFRSSTNKFLPLVIFPMAFFFSYYLWKFTDTLPKISKGVIVSIFAVCIIFYNYPFFTTKFFNFRDIFSNRLVVPNYIGNIKSYYENKVNKLEKTLLVPEFDSGFVNSPLDTYQWGFYSYDSPAQMLGNWAFLSNKSYDDWIIKEYYQSLYSSNSKIFMKYSSLLGISRILFREDVKLSDLTQKSHALASISATLKNNPDLKQDYSSGAWSIFSLKTHNYFPNIYTSNSVVNIYGYAPKDALLLLDETFPERTLILRNNTDNLTDETIAIQNECLMCKKTEFERLVDSIILPPVSALPGTLKYQLVSRRENAAVKYAGNDPAKIIDNHLAFFLTRLSEYKTISELKSLEQSNQIIPLLSASLVEIRKQFSNLNDRSRFLYAIRIKAYMEAVLNMSNGNFVLPEKIVGNMNLLLKIVNNAIWITTDKTGFRGIIEIPRNGTYRIYAPELIDNSYIYVEGNPVIKGDSVFLDKGVHEIEIPRIYYFGNTEDTSPAIFFITASDIHNKTFSVPKISYERINTALYTVDVENADKPFYLQFGQRFDSGWKAYIVPSTMGISALGDNGEKPIQYFNGEVGEYSPKDIFVNNKVLTVFQPKLEQIPDKYHFESNGYANAWKIERKGKYRILLLYKPQKMYMLSLAITGISLLICCLILFYLWRKKRIVK